MGAGGCIDPTGWSCCILQPSWSALVPGGGLVSCWGCLGGAWGCEGSLGEPDLSGSSGMATSMEHSRRLRPGACNPAHVQIHAHTTWRQKKVWQGGSASVADKSGTQCRSKRYTPTSPPRRATRAPRAHQLATGLNGCNSNYTMCLS